MTEVRHKNAAEQMGYTTIPNAVLLNANLSLSAKVLYGVLKHFAWHGSAPAQQRLGEILGVRERAVREYLAELERAGLVNRVRRGLGQSNLYEVVQPAAPQRRADRHVGTDQGGSREPVSTKKEVSTKQEQGSGTVSPYPPDITDEERAIGLRAIDAFRSGS